MSEEIRWSPGWVDLFTSQFKPIPSPAQYKLWAGLSAVSTALERRVYIRTSGGVLFPNLFTLLVGPPGVGKSQAIRSASTLLTEVGKFSLGPDNLTGKGLIDAMADTSCQRQILNAVGWKSYKTLGIFNSEFGVLLPGHDLGFLSILNKMFDCEDWAERTRSGGLLTIENPILQIVAGTQPMYLKNILPESAFGMGFCSRIVMVYHGKEVKNSLELEEVRSKPKLDTTSLKEGLARLAELQGQFKFDPEAARQIDQWHMIDSLNDAPDHSKLIHYNARRTLHLLKLCMIFSAARFSHAPPGCAGTIEVQDFLRSKYLLLQTEERMPQIFLEMQTGGQSADLEEAYFFVVRVNAASQKPVSEHRLVQFLSSRMPAYQIEYVVHTMIKAKMILEVAPTKELNLPARMRDRYFTPNLQWKREQQQ